jgi:hypothetical protein
MKTTKIKSSWQGVQGTKQAEKIATQADMIAFLDTIKTLLEGNGDSDHFKVTYSRGDFSLTYEVEHV